MNNKSSCINLTIISLHISTHIYIHVETSLMHSPLLTGGVSIPVHVYQHVLSTCINTWHVDTPRRVRLEANCGPRADDRRGVRVLSISRTRARVKRNFDTPVAMSLWRHCDVIVIWPKGGGEVGPGAKVATRFRSGRGRTRTCFIVVEIRLRFG